MSYGIGGCCPQCGGEPMTAGFMHRAECPTLRTNRLFEDGVFAVPARSSDPVPQGPWRVSEINRGTFYVVRDQYPQYRDGSIPGSIGYGSEGEARAVCDALNRYEARMEGE